MSRGPFCRGHFPIRLIPTVPAPIKFEENLPNPVKITLGRAPRQGFALDPVDALGAVQVRGGSPVSTASLLPWLQPADHLEPALANGDLAKGRAAPILSPDCAVPVPKPNRQPLHQHVPLVCTSKRCGSALPMTVRERALLVLRASLTDCSCHAKTPGLVIAPCEHGPPPMQRLPLNSRREC